MCHIDESVKHACQICFCCISFDMKDNFKTFMTSQIVPGANQRFHQTPLFWGGQKSPRQRAAYKQDFPIENLHLFTALAGLDSANRVKLKTLGNFFRLHLATPKSGISPRAEVSFFSNCRSLGIRYSSHCYTKNWWFFFGEAKKKLKEIKKASTHDSSSHFLRAKQRVKRFESGETTMTPCYACDRHDQGVVPGLLAPPKLSETKHPSIRGQRTNGPTRHVTSRPT